MGAQERLEGEQPAAKIGPPIDVRASQLLELLAAQARDGSAHLGVVEACRASGPRRARGSLDLRVEPGLLPVQVRLELPVEPRKHAIDASDDLARRHAPHATRGIVDAVDPAGQVEMLVLGEGSNGLRGLLFRSHRWHLRTSGRTLSLRAAPAVCHVRSAPVWWTQRLSYARHSPP